MNLEPNPIHNNPTVVQECTRALEALHSQCRSLVSAAFASDDGFEITRHPLAENQDQRLASMASSLQALTEALAHDRNIGKTEYSLIEAEEGRVLLRRVPGQKIMLLAVFDDAELAGHAVALSRTILEDLSFLLPRSPTPIFSH